MLPVDMPTENPVLTVEGVVDTMEQLAPEALAQRQARPGPCTLDLPQMPRAGPAPA